MVTQSGALMMMWKVSERMPGITRRIKVLVNQITNLFGKYFVLERVEEKDFIVERMKRIWKANWYWLWRK